MLLAMAVQIASNVGPSKIQIAYESFGREDAPPVVLVMGLAAQMFGWHEGFCQELARRHLRVIRFDNRDAGLSTHFTEAGTPDFKAALAGNTSGAPYSLSDMAADTMGLLEALGESSAHFVGASMGGQIVQTIAIEEPKCVRSLVSMMSTTGAPTVGRPAPDVMRIIGGPPTTTREEVIDRAVEMFRVVGSPGFPVDESEVRERAGDAYDRAYDPPGIVRQAVASLASGDRTGRLGQVTAPTLVIHGSDDRMCDKSGGEATANAIPGARLVEIGGMGHNLPRGLWSRVASLIAEHVEQAEAVRGT
jgi:pimeloyl-ACP methyl ester carboxylesterase